MIRYECLQLLASKMSNQLVVTSQSGQRIEWSHLSRHEGNLLVGMMGCAIGVATGLALALPHRKVIALDSDGSVLLSLFNLATLGNLRPKNLVVYVFDNGVYSGSRISYPTATSGNTDLAAMAQGAGIENAQTIRDFEEFKKAGIDALSKNELGFYVCKVEESLLHREIPRPNTDLSENKYTFVRYLERTEEKPFRSLGAVKPESPGDFMPKYLRVLALAVALVISSQRPVGAQDYKDKTLTIIVAYSPGGSFDLYARVLARYIGRYLPGNPTRIVENMTGAGGIIAANHLYNRVKPDGFTIGAWASPLVLQQIMGNEAAQFDGRRFGYLGIPSEYDTVCTFNQQSGIAKMDDWINSKRPQKISTIGPGTSTSDIPKLLKAALNLPMDVIDGYKGGADARLAVESGEVDGYCGSWGTVETVWRSAYESKKIVPVLQVAPKSQPKYKQIPLAISYAKTEDARELLKIADDVHVAQFPFSVPPGMAKDRLELLQSAFMRTFKDSNLIAEAKRSQLDVEPVDGPTITKTLSGLYDLKPATVTRLKDILLPKRK